MFVICDPCITGGHAGYEIAPLVPSLEALLWAVVSVGGPAPGLNTVKHHDMCVIMPCTLTAIPIAGCLNPDQQPGMLKRMPAAAAGTTASRHGTFRFTLHIGIDGATADRSFHTCIH
jgi:hypothetical protein